MKILLSSIGLHDDVQPTLALACQLQHLGHLTRLCVPPNFVVHQGEVGTTTTAALAGVPQAIIPHNYDQL